MPEKHFFEQKSYTKEYLIPYFIKNIPDFTEKKVLEVGCAEGGLLVQLKELGMYVRGVEISRERADLALEKDKNLNIYVGDITDHALPDKLNEKYDFIIMREVVEHLYDKETAFANLDALLNENGFIFMSFPPKYSPFAGHQQIGRSFLKAIPYLHTLPAKMLKPVARFLGESGGYVDEIKLHYSTGCTIREFDLQCRKRKFIPVRKEFYLLRPVYLQRFGLPTVKIPGIPLLKEIISLGCEALLQKVSLIEN